jgi:hypothetical protein
MSFGQLFAIFCRLVDVLEVERVKADTFTAVELALELHPESLRSLSRAQIFVQSGGSYQ